MPRQPNIDHCCQIGMDRVASVDVDAPAKSSKCPHVDQTLPLKRPRPRRVALENLVSCIDKPGLDDKVEEKTTDFKPRRVSLSTISSSQYQNSVELNKPCDIKSKLELTIEHLENEEKLKPKPRARDVVYMKVPRFKVNEGKPNKLASNFFQENGFVVFGDVLSYDQNQKALELMWDYLEGLGSGIIRNVPETYTDEQWPPELDGGILPWLGIGQSKMQWYIRSCHGVQLAFANLWDCKCEDLVSSFDGICVFRDDITPLELNFHVDQNPERITKPDFECIQGLVNLLPTSRESGGNTVIPRSHREYFDKLKAKYPDKVKELEGEDHFVIPNNDSYIERAKQDQRCIVSELRAGDMLLWDSRTIHRNSTSLDILPSNNDLVPTPWCSNMRNCEIEGQEHEKRNESQVSCPGLKRVVSYICMVPKTKVSSETIEKRKLAVRENITTSHWPTRVVDTRCYGSWEIQMKSLAHRFKIPKPPDIDNLTIDQRRLIG